MAGIRATTTTLAAVFALAAGVYSGCGADLLKKGDDDSSKKSEETDGAVEFSGYVQKAFTIKVNGVEFADSENFYTRFIAELVKPKYPDLSGANVELEGKYGLEEFGAQSKVFMSSMAADGHLFESRTDQQSKFTVKVKAKALDETFKARVIIRIGLAIKKDTEDLRYCYILHGTKDNIAISESSKPIIFDDFNTQLNTYKCEDVKEDQLVIPGLETGGSGEGGDSGSENESGSTTVGVGSEVKVSGFPSGKLYGVYSDPTDGSGYFLFGKEKDMETGEEYAPLVKIAADGAVDPSVERHFPGLAGHHDTMFVRTANGTVLFCWQGSAGCHTSKDGKAESAQLSSGPLLQAGSKYWYRGNALDIGTLEQDQAKRVGEEVLGIFAFATTADGAYLLRREADTWRVARVNQNMVVQAEKPFAALEFGKDSLTEAKLWHNGTDLVLVTGGGGELTLRKLTVE